jgi:hypothetical protein
MDAPQRLAEIPATADEGRFKTPFIDLKFVVGGREHLALVDAIHLHRLEHLRLDKMADAHFCHHRNTDRPLDAGDHVGIAGPRDAAMFADVGRHPLERHHRTRSGVFGDTSLLGIDHIHDDAPFELLAKTNLAHEFFGGEAGDREGTIFRLK